MNQPSPLPAAGWTALRVLGVTITVLASIATLIALWLQVREKEPHITAQVITFRRSPTDSASAAFANAVVAMQKTPEFNLEDTWHVQARVVNDGDVTLFTSGPRQ